MDKLLGLVMCGGESRRMGTDKGLIQSGDITWAQLAHNKLTGLGLPVIVSINKTQAAAYERLFYANSLITDGLNLQGPLNGILSVHNAHPTSNLLVLACDMTDMKPATLQHIIDIYLNEPGFDYFAYYQEGFFEPLCAIYTAKALTKLNQSYIEGGLTNYRLQHIINAGNAKKIPVTDVASFHNFNHPGGLSL